LKSKIKKILFYIEEQKYNKFYYILFLLSKVKLDGMKITRCALLVTRYCQLPGSTLQYRAIIIEG
jgi:hypothetical protein